MIDLTENDNNSIFLINLLEDMIVQCNAETREHMWYVGRYAEIIADNYLRLYPSKMTQHKCELISYAARIHDIGKVTIQDALLHKEGRLSVFEFDLYKKHTIKGGQIIKSMSTGQDRELERICYNVCVYHHEKYDGSGYPYGIKDDKIPIEAQIVGLADIYDTLLRCRNREPFTMERVFYMILNDKCGAISPNLKFCFEKSASELENVEYARKVV